MGHQPEYMASYYIISGHTQKHIAGSSHIWYERLKVIKLPWDLVVSEIFCGVSNFTDDSVMTLAVATWLVEDVAHTIHYLIYCMQELGDHL